MGEGDSTLVAEKSDYNLKKKVEVRFGRQKLLLFYASFSLIVTGHFRIRKPSPFLSLSRDISLHGTSFLFCLVGTKSSNILFF